MYDLSNAHPEWQRIQREIADCTECCSRWHEEVDQRLKFGEMPPPPNEIGVLFVGVAPTPINGKNKGAHFYSSVKDPLRVGLFRLLGKMFRVPLLGLDLEKGNRAFHELRCFFVHSTKVRPIKESAPSHETIRFCVFRHCKAEILFLRPRAICFLGMNHAKPAAEALFEKDFGQGPVQSTVKGWAGQVAVVHQPIPRLRRWEDHTAEVLEELFKS